MKARVIKKDGNILLLCKDGTMSSSPEVLKYFFNNFKDEYAVSNADGRWTDIALDMGEIPGETLAYTTDNGQLVIVDQELLRFVYGKAGQDEPASKINDYLTVDEYAKKYDRSPGVIKLFIKQDRIPGIIRFGRQIAIPADAPYPVGKDSQKPNSGRTASGNNKG